MFIEGGAANAHVYDREQVDMPRRKDLFQFGFRVRFSVFPSFKLHPFLR